MIGLVASGTSGSPTATMSLANSGTFGSIITSGHGLAIPSNAARIARCTCASRLSCSATAAASSSSAARRDARSEASATSKYQFEEIWSGD